MLWDEHGSSDIPDDHFKRRHMKEERGLLRDVIGTARPEEESKIKKYIRIILACVGIGFFVAVIVMAALRRYGS